MSDHSKLVTAADAKKLFAPWRNVPAMVVAVSGGPDSVALLWLLARWRRALKTGPRLFVVTIDHGLRGASAREASEVKRLAATLDLPHRTLRWTGAKPKTGLPAAARQARYRLLAKAAADCGAAHVLTAHTLDDQAETLLMRLMRGSGLAGLAAMTPESQRDGITLVRPFLQVPKAQLMATLIKAGIAFVTDPTNFDPRYTRPRLRALMSQLAQEGCDAGTLARLASRLARGNATLERVTDDAERLLDVRHGDARGSGIDFVSFAMLPEEIRLRLLLRIINRVGHEGPAELAKAEDLLRAIDRAANQKAKQTRLKQTLAGALITIDDGRMRIEPAPLRRRRSV